MKQARARIYRGDTHAEGKIVSLFEPSTEVIRKGKAAKPNEFGKMIKLQEARRGVGVTRPEFVRRDRFDTDQTQRFGELAVKSRHRPGGERPRLTLFRYHQSGCSIPIPRCERRVECLDGRIRTSHLRHRR